MFFLFFIFFIFLLIFFVGLGPAQPTWAGLSPAGPAWSLAQACDPAGLHEARVIQITRAWLLLINSNRQRKWEQRRKGKKNRVCLPGSAENLCEVAEDDTYVFELPLIPYACISRCILCLGFVCSRLKDYSSALFF